MKQIKSQKKNDDDGEGATATVFIMRNDMKIYRQSSKAFQLFHFGVALLG